MSLAENVKHYQELKNMTTQEFAAKANLPVDTINKIRAGATQNPSMDTLKRMAAALNCSIDQLADMPEPDLNVRELLPKNLPMDHESLAEMFCGTLHRQQMAHENAIYEVRKDRKWWRVTAITVVVISIILLVVLLVLVALLYWDLSHPAEGNIIYTIDSALR